MDVKTYRARSMQEALDLVRSDLGPDAALLHSREVSGGLFGWRKRIEVTASATVHVPSRLPEDHHDHAEAMWDESEDEILSRKVDSGLSSAISRSDRIPAADGQDHGARLRASLKGQPSDLDMMMAELGSRGETATAGLPDGLFELRTTLLDAEVDEELVRELIERVRASSPPGDCDDPVLMKSRLTRLVEEDIRVSGPIAVTRGKRRMAALVGPTGVGKTTTIAKLAANFRLREKVRVGLITVDTYRIAAVDQLRTYADIIDLPMEVVATPHQMRAAVKRLESMDLILLDTAGRSPQDELRLQELKSILAEAQPDEVHLVLSSVAGANGLKRAAQQFRDVGVTSLMLSKLDEASGLGNLLPLLRGSQLPLSYVTHGQNVPDDIAPADRRKLARAMLGMGRKVGE